MLAFFGPNCGDTPNSYATILFCVYLSNLKLIGSKNSVSTQMIDFDDSTMNAENVSNFIFVLFIADLL